MNDPITMLGAGFAHVLQGGAVWHALWATLVGRWVPQAA